ncbi:MAG: SAM-dependent methyltransferase [Microthrixaceae bacterium]
MIDELRARIQREGSVRFDELVELALYDPVGGFFSRGGGAGRAGADFITSPEVGPLFGALVAEYLDRCWESLGRPDPFVVVEAAAGRGALAISVLAAGPRCAEALRYVLVERSAALRRRQHEHLAIVHPFEVLGPSADDDLGVAARGSGGGPLVGALDELPAQPVEGVVLANELLDNVPFRLLERVERGWAEIRVTLDGDELVELAVPADGPAAQRLDRLAPEAEPGARVPLQDRATDWVLRAHEVVARGTVLVIDYASTTAAMAGRPMGEWLRTYRAHDRGLAPLRAVGDQDLTCEVAIDQLVDRVPGATVTSQASWLGDLGIGELVAEGRAIWSANAASPDLAAIRAASRVPESEALTDPTGLGAFQVVEWRR